MVQSLQEHKELPRYSQTSLDLQTVKLGSKKIEDLCLGDSKHEKGSKYKVKHSMIDFREVFLQRSITNVNLKDRV